MTDGIRKALDALMGSNRNGDKPTAQKHFSDPDICKYYLAGLCPHELFTNTQDYEEAQKTKDYGYEHDLEKLLEKFAAECDRKVVKAQKRIEEVEGSKKAQDQISVEINDLYTKAEELGEEGKVDEAKQLLLRAEQLKQQRIPLQPQLLLFVSNVDNGGNQQKLRVCDICSSYLSIYDSDRRLADHFGGKLHIGYHLIREKLKDLQKLRKEKGEEKTMDRDRSKSISREENERDRQMEKDRSRDKQRDRQRTINNRDKDQYNQKERDKRYERKRK